MVTGRHSRIEIMTVSRERRLKKKKIIKIKKKQRTSRGRVVVYPESCDHIGFDLKRMVGLFCLLRDAYCF